MYMHKEMSSPLIMLREERKRGGGGGGVVGLERKKTETGRLCFLPDE